MSNDKYASLLTNIGDLDPTNPDHRVCLQLLADVSRQNLLDILNGTQSADPKQALNFLSTLVKAATKLSDKKPQEVFMALALNEPTPKLQQFLAVTYCNIIKLQKPFKLIEFLKKLVDAVDAAELHRCEPLKQEALKNITEIMYPKEGADLTLDLKPELALRANVQITRFMLPINGNADEPFFQADREVVQAMHDFFYTAKSEPDDRLIKAVNNVAGVHGEKLAYYMSRNDATKIPMYERLSQLLALGLIKPECAQTKDRLGCPALQSTATRCER